MDNSESEVCVLVEYCRLRAASELVGAGCDCVGVAMLLDMDEIDVRFIFNFDPIINHLRRTIKEIRYRGVHHGTKVVHRNSQTNFYD